jgi:uridine kinase
VTISIDNYFLERENTPRLPDGSFDFESIKAIDVDLLNRHLIKLLKGKKIEIPAFDFATGERHRGNRIRISKNQILIVEGIHGLNEQLTHQIPRKHKLKIYISALTQMNIDNDHRISTRDSRILRRMVRDRLFRGHSANETFKLWQNVQKGEDVNIFPFQEEADVMFNSALVYELSVLKRFATPLLRGVTPKQRNYSKSDRLLQVLSFFLETAPSEVPPTSILREFIGGSSFLY